jgi:hypothetical protein
MTVKRIKRLMFKREGTGGNGRDARRLPRRSGGGGHRRSRAADKVIR